MKSRSWLEDDNGYPWSSYIPFWIVVPCILFSHTLLFALALFLSLWLAGKRHRKSLVSFSITTALGFLALLAGHWHVTQPFHDRINEVVIGAFVISLLCMRDELLALYRECGEEDIEISVGFTLLFNIAFLNYATNPSRAPFWPTESRVPDTVISLKLSAE